MNRLIPKAIVRAISKRKRQAKAVPVGPPTPFPVFEGTPDQRAEALLRSMLTTEELSQWTRLGYVEVTGKSGNVYRLYTHGNKVVTGSHGWRSMCVWIRPEGWGDPLGRYGPMAPHADHTLACILHIKTNEAAFLKVARIY